MVKFYTKKMVLFALLGATWGVVEAQLGTLLHGMGVPFVGSFMIAISLAFLITGKYVTDFRASSIALALNASMIKFLFTGGIGLFQIIGIMFQAIIFDLVIGKQSQSARSCVFGGIAIVTYSLFHPFITQGILGGMKILQVYSKLVTLGGNLFGTEQIGVLIFLFLIIFHIIIGATSSLIWFNLIVKLESRGLIAKVAK